MAISFFYRRGGHAGEIRAKQIAYYLGEKINPLDGYQDDVCVVVKVRPGIIANQRSILEKYRSLYVDVLDYWQIVSYLRRHPRVGIIASSSLSFKYLSSFCRNDIRLIPQHHCNEENLKRTNTDVTTVGVIGELRSFEPYEEEIRSGIEKLGMKFLPYHKYNYRHDVVKFYKKIDIQIVWRLPLPEFIGNLKNPMRIYNAGSFGIPTVAFPENCFVEEFNGCFIPANTIPELLDHIRMLRDSSEEYRRFSELAEEKSSNYHISKIAELYRQLEA